MRLTPRESQIVSLIGQGLTNHQISDQSYLSVNSIKRYIRSAYGKMGWRPAPTGSSGRFGTT